MDQSAQQTHDWSKPTASIQPEEFNGVPMLTRALIFATAGAVAAGIIWASQAEILEVAVGEGRVIPARKVQLVQNLEGGIIQEIAIAEGDRVSLGDILVQIDTTSINSSLGERRQHIASLSASQAWLTALLESVSLQYDQDFERAFPEFVLHGRMQYNARKAENDALESSLKEQIRQKEYELKSSIARMESTKLQLGNATETLSMHQKLLVQKATSRSDVLDAETRVLELKSTLEDLANSIPSLSAGISEIKSKRLETRARARSELTQRLNEVSVKLDALKSAVVADEDRIERTNVRSPVEGIVKTLHTNTLGQVVKPGENILEIVPLGEQLVVETNVSPSDIAFIYPTQPAVIKITAYDSAIYGHLDGKVTRIAADSVVDDRGNAFYKVDIQSDTSLLNSQGKPLPIIPGMVASVEIVTGSKTVFDYVTKPIHRTAKTAFRER